MGCEGTQGKPPEPPLPAPLLDATPEEPPDPIAPPTPPGPSPPSPEPAAPPSPPPEVVPLAWSVARSQVLLPFGVSPPLPGSPVDIEAPSSEVRRSMEGSPEQPSQMPAVAASPFDNARFVRGRIS